MPIEIKELTVKIEVTQSQFESDNKQEANKLTPLAKKQLIKECVEEVIRKLEDKFDR